MYRHVQRVHIGHGRHAFPKGIETAPVQRISVISDVGFRVATLMTSRFPNASGLIWLHARAADFFDEQAAGRQRGVAKHFAVHGKSRASQSSNSGWLGRPPMTPKSSVVSTSPAPKSSAHMRLTVTRAVRGFD